ncbi:hypothetical protein [Microbacterium sp.]|uniref:hypothetical protein n=1 Tax=Microbacterium sp. TaxID=51671 RepID=UPI0039E62909
MEAYVGADAILESWRAAGGRFDGSGWTALGSMVNLLNPQRIVVGGWVGLRLMESRADAVLAATRARSLDRFAGQFDLLPATFGGDTVALGSALLPIEQLIAQGRGTELGAAHR